MNLNLLEQLKQSPIGKQLASDFQSETLKKRQAAAGEIKRITAELVKALPGVLKAREKAEADVKAAEEVLRKAREAYGRAHGDVHNLTIRADVRRNTQEQILRGSYPKEIDAFKDEMNTLLTRTRSKGIDHRDHGHQSIVDSKWKPKVYSDSEAVHARLKYLQAAIGEAEELKLQALPAKEVVERLEELKSKVPRTGSMELVQ